MPYVVFILMSRENNIYKKHKVKGIKKPLKSGFCVGAEGLEPPTLPLAMRDTLNQLS